MAKNELVELLKQMDVYRICKICFDDIAGYSEFVKIDEDLLIDIGYSIFRLDNSVKCASLEPSSPLEPICGMTAQEREQMKLAYELNQLITQ